MSPYTLHLLNLVAVYAIAVIGLHIIVGLCGQFSLAQGAFFGIGEQRQNHAVDASLVKLSNGLELSVGVVFGIREKRHETVAGAFELHAANDFAEVDIGDR